MAYLSREHLADTHRATIETQKLDNSFIVDLDAEKGQTRRGDRENKHRVAVMDFRSLMWVVIAFQARYLMSRRAAGVQNG